MMWLWALADLEPSPSLLYLYHNIQLYSTLSSLSPCFVYTTYCAACLKPILRFKNKFKHYIFIESFLVSVPKAMYKAIPSFVSPNTPWHLAVFPFSPSSRANSHESLKNKTVPGTVESL